MVSQKEIHDNAQRHGFWSIPNVGEKIALIHSELSEALEADRNDIPRGQKGWIGEELADTVIRILDLAEFLGIELENVINNKHEVNVNRPFKHGKRY